MVWSIKQTLITSSSRIRKKPSNIKWKSWKTKVSTMHSLKLLMNNLNIPPNNHTLFQDPDNDLSTCFRGRCHDYPDPKDAPLPTNNMCLVHFTLDENGEIWIPCQVGTGLRIYYVTDPAGNFWNRHLLRPRACWCLVFIYPFSFFPPINGCHGNVWRVVILAGELVYQVVKVSTFKTLGILRFTKARTPRCWCGTKPFT